jgi:hypothetical protein
MTSQPAKHRDDSPEATIRGEALDLMDSVTMPIRHYVPRHSAFVAKVREVTK